MTPSTSTIKKKQEEGYPLHDLAKVLNNRAANVITTTGNYEEERNLFVTALKLTEQSILLESGSDKAQVPCSCKFHPSSSVCSSPSTRMDVVVDDDDDVDDFRKQESHATKTKEDGSINPSSVEVPMDYHDDLHDNTTPSTTTTNNTLSSHYQEENAVKENNDGGFVYRRFLLIDDPSINENYYIGSTLSLVIIFNLALSLHLIGIDNDDNNKESLSSSLNPIDVIKNTESLQHAMKLYEIAYQLHSNYIQQQSFHTDNNNTMYIDDIDDDDHDNNDNDNDNRAADAVVSLRFIIIVSNNIGQIHRVAGNTKKYTRCLQHLLSSIMCVVGQQQLAIVHNTLFNSMEFDGLIRNVSSIVFRGSICASAA